jgi:hypothetical protein
VVAVRSAGRREARFRERLIPSIAVHFVLQAVSTLTDRRLISFSKNQNLHQKTIK